MLLENKVALVTGSSRGIGAAIAKGFAREGCKVVINYNKSKEAGETGIDILVDDGFYLFKEKNPEK